jgi:hypothetical protein
MMRQDSLALIVIYAISSVWHRHWAPHSGQAAGSQGPQGGEPAGAVLVAGDVGTQNYRSPSLVNSTDTRQSVIHEGAGPVKLFGLRPFGASRPMRGHGVVPRRGPWCW